MRYTIFFVLFILLAPWVDAQQRVMNAYDVFELKTVMDAAISPDGEHIAYTVSAPRPFSEGDGSNYTHLFVYDKKTGSSKPFIAGKNNVYNVEWTPDGSKILFLASMGENKNLLIYAIDLDGGEAYPFLDIAYQFNSFKISPDGRRIAFTASSIALQLYQPYGFKQQVYEEDNRDVELLLYDMDSKKTTTLIENRTVKDFIWSPDGQSIAAQIIDRNLIDHDYMFRELVIFRVDDPNPRVLVEKNGKRGKMAFSPDGKYIALISGTSLYDPVAGSLFIVPVGGPKQPIEDLKNLVQGMELSVTDVGWIDRQTVVYSADEGCNTVLRAMNFQGGKQQQLIEGGKVFFSGFNTNGKEFAFPGNTSQHPSELFLFNREDKSLNKLSSFNPWLSDILLGKQEVIEYRAKDGLRIEGVLIYPTDYQPSKRYPCITLIHGGPEACMDNGWQTSYSRWGQVAAGEGYFVFMPNYRASSGRGVKFSMLDYGKLGEEEFTDVLDGIDYLDKKGLIDKTRVGIGGGSYGGYFAALGSTKYSSHFAASVVFVGISNQISKRNATDIPMEDLYVHWGFKTSENYEKVYKASPIAYAERNVTPTLILHGTVDPRIPPTQSLELYRVLKEQNKAPVRLVWYPGEGHGNRKNPARLDYMLRTMAWFDYYLKDQGPKDKMPPKDMDYKIKLK